MRSLLLALALAVVGCGPGGGPGLDPAFSGTWTGPVTVFFEGENPFTYDGSLTIAAAERTASLSTLCVTGSSPVTLNGRGTELLWSGSWVCPAFSRPDCASIVPTLTSGRLDLESDDTLSGHSFGSASGCGTTRQMTVTIALTK